MAPEQSLTTPTEKLDDQFNPRVHKGPSQSTFQALEEAYKKLMC